ncbi:hypothetical protein MTR67_038624 [Solanum verrucosum]|uniref:Uncharacterized protein n=1 Tax=Solanum verrucosum TaxID=315347 RepID=A0AAF0UH59_SOLVR|nr:hypothetical protein MTR67_038624 [Solanum verrucosum]
MSSGGDSDRHREHLRVSHTKQAKKKKSRRPIDPEDIAGSISSAPERISHDTHILIVLFGTADPRQYYPNYRRPVGTSSTSQAVPSVHYEDLALHAIHRGRPLSAATPSATPDEMLHLVPGQKHRLGRVMIVPDRSSSGSEKELGRTPIAPEVFKKTHVRKKENESNPDEWVEERVKQTFNEFQHYLAENLDSSVEMTPQLSTHIWKEKVVGGTHKGTVYGLGYRNNIAAMSDQIAKLIAALAESERRRVVEKEIMSKTVHQIQKQVMNLARGTTTSAPKENDDYSTDSEDDCVGPIP